MARPEWIEVGRVSRAHGVRGEVRIMADSDNPERFAPEAVVFARPARTALAGPSQPERLRLTVEYVRGDDVFPIVAFREIETRESAEGLRGHVLEVPGAELPDLDVDEFYPFDLEGLQVRDPGGVAVGVVAEVIDSPAHPLLALRLDSGREVLVPFVAAAVPVVDLAGGFVMVEQGFVETDEAGRS
jgi:16S rRNA processing protein RimM